MDVTKIKINPRVIKAVVTDFVDFKGDTHKITAVAYDSLTGHEFWHDDDVKKVVSFGISIQNPQDEYVEAIGINRAAKGIEKKISEGQFVPEITSNYVAGKILMSLIPRKSLMLWALCTVAALIRVSA